VDCTFTSGIRCPALGDDFRDLLQLAEIVIPGTVRVAMSAKRPDHLFEPLVQTASDVEIELA
jgi:hypothetical protein